ncbi:MAG: hypothetical protein KDD69_12645 [Bdellovibrionales bacterium]|nr:hypothetical protein [Bdellovibrionales bacterium]
MAYLEPGEPLWELLDRLVREEGLFLYDAERLGGNGVRISIDAQQPEDPHVTQGEGTGGEASKERVTSGDCSKVCRRLMVQLAVEGPAHGLPAEPVIEVSSPGVYRELRLPQHYRGAIGERVKVFQHAAGGIGNGSTANGRAGKPKGPVVIGVLRSFEDGAIVVIDEHTSEAVSFELGMVRKANVEFRFE